MAFAKYPDGIRRRILYDGYNLPFSEILALNIFEIVLQLKTKKAVCVIIDGMSGDGKTTLGVHLVDYINTIFNIPYNTMKGISKLDTHAALLSLRKLLINIPKQYMALDKEHIQLALGGKQFQTNIYKCADRGFHSLVYDEAGDFSKKSTMTRFNIVLSRTWDTYRIFDVLPIVCIPNFNELDASIFKKGIPKLLIHCYNKSLNDNSYRAYGIREMHFLRKWMKKGDYCDMDLYFKVSYNFQGHSLRLHPEREKMLDELSAKGKIKANLKTNLELNNLVSYYDIARELGLEARTVALKIKNSKIKHKQIYERKKYFERGTIGILRRKQIRRN